MGTPYTYDTALQQIATLGATPLDIEGFSKLTREERTNLREAYEWMAEYLGCTTLFLEEIMLDADLTENDVRSIWAESADLYAGRTEEALSWLN